MRVLPVALALASATLLIALTTSTSAQQVNRPANAVTVFAGQITSNNWEDFLAPTDIRFRSAFLAGAGLSRRLTTLFDALDLEVLGQVARHFGNAHQWEFDAALGIRWTHFPWNDTLPTSLAFGVGPSYETQTPPEEKAINGQSKQWLGFWVAELEVGPPESLWSGVARIHHRSTAFGLFGRNGGSNTVALGVRVASS